MRRQHRGGQDQDRLRVNFDLIVQSNRASRQRTAQRAADTFWGMPPPLTRHPSPSAQQVAQAVRQDEQSSRQRQLVVRQPLGFNPGQYRDEQRHSLLAQAAEALITTPLSIRPAGSHAGLMGPLRPVMSEVDVWMGTELTLSLRPSAGMHIEAAAPVGTVVN